jgi:hypothetical protein
LIVTFLGIALPALAGSLALRRWFAPLPWRIVALSFVLTLAFLHGAVFSSRVPVPLGEVMRGYPYRGVIGAVESRNPLTNDTVKQILPWMQVVREELAAGRVPLWNRYQFSGYPLLGNGQSAPFAPVFLATLFVPLPHQLVAMAGLKIFFALLFGWLFLRDEDVSSPAALFGSAAFAFSVFQTVYLYYPMSAVTSLLPAAAFAVRGCLRSDGRRWGVLLAIVTASVAANGHPESAVHIGIACVVLMIVERRAPWRALVAAAFGAALSAPAWMPVIEQALASTRAASLAAAPHVAMDPLVTWLFLNPDGFGNPSRGNWQWIYNYSMAAPTYLGLVTLVLLAGIRKRRDVALLVAASLLFLVAMDWTVVGRAFNAVPPMSLIAPDRLRFVVLFFAAVIAARVVDAIAREQRRDWRVLAASAALLGAAVWLLRAKWGVTLGSSSTGGVIALGVFAIVATARPKLAAILACCAIVAELFAFNAGFNVLTSPGYYRPRMPILDAMRELSGNEPSRIAAHDWTFLPNAASQYGFEDVRGHDPMALASYARFFDRVAADDPSSDVKRIHDVDHPALDFLGVRFLLTDPSFVPSAAWTLRYEGPDGKLFESREWRRRFFVTDGSATIGRIEQVSPARIRVEVDAAERAFIASSQVFAPGWRIADGRDIEPVDGTFIGFRVEPGRHRVTLEYLPRSFTAAVAIAAVALLAAAATLQRRRIH